MKKLKLKVKKPTKKFLIYVLIVCLFINTTLISLILIPSYAKYKEEKESQEKLKNATIIVDLKENLSIDFLSKAKVSDFIENINGKLVDDYEIDTTKLGEQLVNFEYINNENITIPYSYKINVIDEIAPVIWLDKTYTINTSYEGNLIDDIVCADNLDDNPKCEIIGTYNTKIVGEYNLTFQATDKSGNKTIKDFILSVEEPSSNQQSNNTKTSSISFNDIIKKYKNNNTKIGIDVSSWQGDIDFEKVKNAGVEFVFIRVGSTKGINGEYFLDNNFINNIRGFNEVDIPVGIYFYSYANSKYSAIRDANWVLEQIKGYDVELPVAYDWESWSFYNDFNLSFYNLTNNAKAFLDTINEKGYDGLLYSSKNYLEDVWYDTGYDIWLANYTEQTTYEGNYKYWQLCTNGIVDGINGFVDINILYE